MVLHQDDMLSMLECPVCFALMVAPIALCQNGHNLCGGCRDKLTVCPVCQGSFTQVRNRALEAIAETVPLPCENSIAGCSAKLLPSERDDHIAICSHRPYECLPRKEKGCKWRGARDKLYEHLTEDHLDLFTYAGLPSKVTFNTRLAFEGIRLAKLNEELFWIHMKQDPQSLKFFRAIQYIGPVENASKFEYSYEFSLAKDSTSFISFRRRAYSEADDMSEKYEQDNDFCNIVSCVMKCLENDGCLVCSLNIKRVTEAE